jgi:acetyl-CoA acyltransferase
MRDVFVAGGAMTKFGRFPETTLEEMGRAAIIGALADSEIGRDQIEVAYAGHARTGRLHQRENGVGQLCLWAAGIRDIPVTGVGNYCASGSSALREAWIAVGSGLYDVAIAIGIEKLSSRAGRGRPITSDGMEMEGCLGFTPPAFFAMSAQRYMAETGATRETLAKVAVKNRAHASHNPSAQYRTPLTVDEVLAAPVVADPLTRLSCCPTSDGAAAVVLVSDRARARPNGRDAVRLSGSGLVSGGYRAEDMSHFELDRRAGAAAYEMAGIEPSDIDVAELHDAFTFTESAHYEDLGFCGFGEGVRLVEDGETSVGGSIPVGTSGGLLSRGHPLGATGVAQAIEIVTQLRGEAAGRQVEGAKVGMAHCVGGFLDNDAAASAVHIFSK